jgi:alpha-beta hydrolase superfamily lysophospholipase
LAKSLDVVRLRAEFREPHELVKMSDGAEIFLRHWVPLTSISDIALLIFHGITAHSGPYGKILGNAIAGAGFHVYGIDIRGHGLSDGTRGDYPSEERLIADICETAEFVKTRASKVVVVGHSLGVLSAGILARNCLETIDGLVLLCGARKMRPGVYKRSGSRTMIRNLAALTLFKGKPLIEYSRSGMLGPDDPLFNFRYSARFLFLMYGASGRSFVKMMSSGELGSQNLISPSFESRCG